MNPAWQNLIVLLAVAVACAYLARRGWQSVARRKVAGCGACGDCPSVAQGSQMVALEHLSESAKTVAGSKSSGPQV